MKICKRCKTEKELKQFYKFNTSKDGKSYWCKDCIKAYSKAKNNKEIKSLYNIITDALEKGLINV